MKVFNKPPKLPEDSLDSCKAASPTDCTGVIQVPPEDNDEYQAYNEVYNFAPELSVNLKADKEAMKKGNN